MKKEPIGLYIFRCTLGIATFALMGMLYWSSLMIEKNLNELHNEMTTLCSNHQNFQNEPLQTPLNDDISYVSVKDESKHSPAVIAEANPITSSKHSPRSQINPQLPNLLTDDPFYTSTLPKLLGKNFKPYGTFKGATLGRPNNLHPFSGWAQVSGWQGLCTTALAASHFGKYEVYAPAAALKIEERKIDDSGRIEYWIHLRSDLYWHPLKQELFQSNLQLAPHFLHEHRLTAHDFKFYFDAIMNPHVQSSGAVALRTYYEDIESFQVIDDVTFVVRWKSYPLKNDQGEEVYKSKYMAKGLTCSLQPLPIFVYAYFADGKKIIDEDDSQDPYRTNLAWAQNFAEHWARNIIVSCGPWLFDGMTEREIRFKRNPHYFLKNAALADATTFQFKETTDTWWQDFKSNQIDSYVLQANQLTEMEDFLSSNRYKTQESENQGIDRLDYTARTYWYIGWNEENPYFSNKNVRQAMTMAIDRQRIIRQYLNHLGIEISSPFSPHSTAYDPELQPWPFDLQRARQLLEMEGWYDSDNDGTIDKMIGGKSVPFKFTLTYFVKNSVIKSVCEYIATALRELGIDCALNGLDIADLTAAFEDKSFDAICMGWALGTPPENPRQLWHSSGAKEKGSSNAIGFANKEIDEIIEALDYEEDSKKRQELYFRFDAIFHEEAPYTLLYTPKTVFLYRQYLQNVFIPSERQDLVPKATVGEPDSSIFWLKDPKTKLRKL